MSERGLGTLLARRLQDARDDAERIARELAEAGHLEPEVAARLTSAVDAAVEQANEMVSADALADAIRRLEEALARLTAAGARDDAD